MKKDIINACLKTCAYQDASIGKIMADCGMSKAALHYYFPTKYALLSETDKAIIDDHSELAVAYKARRAIERGDLRCAYLALSKFVAGM